MGKIILPAGYVADFTKPKKAPKVKKGTITKIEAATARERVFVVNGVKFFAAVGGTGHRLLTACDGSKKKLESAARVLEIKGYATKVKRNKDDKRLWMLEAKERVPSGPWPELDPLPAPKVEEESVSITLPPEGDIMEDGTLRPGAKDPNKT